MAVSKDGAPSPEEVEAVLKAAKEGGGMDGLIAWAGRVGFNECVASIEGSERASKKIDDPKKLCGWLKARAREMGLLSEEHGGEPKGKRKKAASL